jgi:membrane-associated protein
MKRDPPVSAALRMEPERDLLRHRARRHPEGGLLPEQCGDAGLEALGERALPVMVDLVDSWRAFGEGEQRPARIALTRAWGPDDAPAFRPHISLVTTVGHPGRVRGRTSLRSDGRLLNGLADQLSGAWWAYLLVFGLAYADVLFPLVPSETTVITAGVLSSAGDMHLSLVILAGGAGAVAGDNTAYLLGHYFEVPLRRRLFAGEKAQRRIRWAERQIDERGGQLIVVARFIPGGRTVVTFASGWLEMSWRRFITFDVIAGFAWAAYAALLGYFGGKAFENAPWKGLLLAFGIALAVTAGVEAVRWLRRRRS